MRKDAATCRDSRALSRLVLSWAAFLHTDLGGPALAARESKPLPAAIKPPTYNQLGNENMSLFQVSESWISRLAERSLVLLGKLRSEQTLLFNRIGRATGSGTKVTFFPFFFF